jgi:hypothetical protein
MQSEKGLQGAVFIPPAETGGLCIVCFQAAPLSVSLDDMSDTS